MQTHQADRALRIPLPRPATELFLFGAMAILLLVYVVLALVHEYVSEVHWLWLQMFDVDDEHNLPTFFSGFILLCATLILWCICSESGRFRAAWFGLFLGFAFLSMDEIAGFHEAFNMVTDPVWAWTGLGIAAVVGLLFIPLLLSLPRATAIGMGISGALYVGGAAVVELLNAPMDSDSLGYRLAVMVEEGLEMLGIIVFICVLLAYRARPRAA